MVMPLTGDKFTEKQCIKKAKKAGCPASNICRICGIEIVVMAYTMTGACCGDHEKERWGGDKPK